MKKIIFLVLFVSALIIYNSNAFQSLFMTEKYYTPIFDGKIDILNDGARLKLKIDNRYNCKHGIFIAVPGRYNFDNLNKENGILSYKFIANNKIIANGTTAPPERRNTTRLKSRSAVCILEFDIPQEWNSKNVFLTLKVNEPMTFLSQYSSNTTCVVRPVSEYK